MKWYGKMSNKKKMMIMNILKQKRINGMRIKKLSLKMKKQRKLLEQEQVLDMQIENEYKEIFNIDFLCIYSIWIQTLSQLETQRKKTLVLYIILHIKS